MFKQLYKKRAMKGYDKWADSYESDVVFKIERRGYTYNQLAKKIVSNITPDDERKNILEVGTGTAVLGKEVRKENNDIYLYGADISLNMLLKSKEANVYEEAVHTEASETPFNDSTFDLLYSTFMIHNAYSIINVLREFERITKPLSRIVIGDLMIKNEKDKKIYKISQLIHSLRHEKGALSNYISPEHLKELIHQTNLKIVNFEMLGEDIRYTHYLFTLVNEKPEKVESGGFKCKKCGTILCGLEDFAKTTITCPKCGNTLDYSGGIIHAIESHE